MKRSVWMPAVAPAPESEREWVNLLDVLEGRAMVKATLAVGGAWSDDFGDQPRDPGDLFAWRDVIIGMLLPRCIPIMEDLESVRIWVARSATMTPFLLRLMSGYQSPAVQRALRRNPSYRRMSASIPAMVLQDLDGIPARALRGWRQMVSVVATPEGGAAIRQQWDRVWMKLLDLNWASVPTADAASRFLAAVPWIDGVHLVTIAELILSAHERGAMVIDAVRHLARHPGAGDAVARLLLGRPGDKLVTLLLAAEPSLARLPDVRKALAPLKAEARDPILVEAFMVGCEGSDAAEWRYHMGSMMELDLERAAQIACSVDESLLLTLPGDTLSRLAETDSVREILTHMDVPASYLDVARRLSAYRGDGAMV